MLVASVAGAILAERAADRGEAELRARRLETQRLEQRLHRLDADGALTTLEALEESRDALRVRLVEALNGARDAPDIGVLRHHLAERAMPDASAAATLRLSIEGRVAHGAALLDLLGAVEAASRPWPKETRGCTAQRLEEAVLAVDCTIDILHWEGLDAPLVR